MKISREFMIILSNHTLNSHDFSDGLISIDIRGRNFMLIHYQRLKG